MLRHITLSLQEELQAMDNDWLKLVCSLLARATCSFTSQHLCTSMYEYCQFSFFVFIVIT